MPNLSPVSQRSVRCGPSWEDLIGFAISDRDVTQLMAFLGSTRGDDLVNTSYNGSFSPAKDSQHLVEIWNFVGSDGAGKRLERRKFDLPMKDLKSSFLGIYLFESRDHGGIRYAIVDDPGDSTREKIKSSSKTLVCREEVFEQVYSILGMGGSGGAVWRGVSLEDPKSYAEIDETKFVFADGFLEGLRRQTVDFLVGEEADRLRSWGSRPKIGVLLEGAPGNGKTIISRLCGKYALEAGLNVVVIEGARESRSYFDREALGVGDQLRKGVARGPCLFIFEDLDLHCRPQSETETRIGKSNTALIDLLDFLDGIEPTQGYALLASANAPESLSPALLRPGRIDVRVRVAPPTADIRPKVLASLLTPGPEPAPDTRDASDLLDGCSSAELAEVARRFKVAVALNSSVLSSGEHERILVAAAEAFIDERRESLSDGET